MPTNFTSTVLTLLVIGAVAYKIPFFSRRKLFHISLLQIMYFFIIPSMIFIFLNSYLLAITATPSSHLIALSDFFLTNLILLSTLLAFGGKAIHVVTKTLSETALRDDKTEVGQINKYLHLKFSHNLMYIGGLLIILGLTLIEINHSPLPGTQNLTPQIVRGAVLGLFFVISMYNYTVSRDKYTGRWADLKPVFFVSLICLGAVTFLVQRVDVPLRQYQLLIPALLGMGLINAIPLLLLFRRVRTRRSRSSQ